MTHFFGSDFEFENEPTIFLLWDQYEHTRIENFAEIWIGLYLDFDFFQLFRMTKTVFSKLQNGIINNPQLITKPYQGGGVPMSIEKQLLVTLWWLQKGETLMPVSNRFNLVISSVYNCTTNLLNVLISLQYKYIIWPNMEEMVTIEEEFRTFKLPRFLVIYIIYFSQATFLL